MFGKPKINLSFALPSVSYMCTEGFFPLVILVIAIESVVMVPKVCLQADFCYNKRRIKMDRGVHMGQNESKLIASAAIQLALSSDRETEYALKKQFAAQGIKASAVDYGGEFIASVQKVVERAVVAAKRRCYCRSHQEEGGVERAREACRKLCKSFRPEYGRQSRHCP